MSPRVVRKCKYVTAAALITMCALLRIYTLPPHRPRLEISHSRAFSFIRALGTDFCPDLFREEQRKSVLPGPPPEYAALYEDFRRELDAQEAPAATLRAEEALVIRRLAALPGVTRICQLGLHTGYETLVLLTAKTANRVVVFDHGVELHTRPMAAYLKKHFRGRLDVVFGDPETHVPVRAYLSGEQCDMVVARGSHSRHTLVREVRAAARASVHEAVVVMDNYPVAERAGGERGAARRGGKAAGRREGEEEHVAGAWEAWEALRVTGEYSPHLTCSYLPGRQGPAFTVGIITEV